MSNTTTAKIKFHNHNRPGGTLVGGSWVEGGGEVTISNTETGQRVLVHRSSYAGGWVVETRESRRVRPSQRVYTDVYTYREDAVNAAVEALSD